MMPDITQRIADILNKHTPSGATGLVNCWCGIADFHTFGQQAAHVAEVLVSELGLTQEWSIGTRGKQIMMSERAAKDKAARWPESFEASSRYVTEWVPDE